MKHLSIITVLVLMLSFSSCHDAPKYENNLSDTYKCLWTLLDEHYCYFHEKGIDWREAGILHAADLDTVKTWREVFEVCSDLIEELRDGHINLISGFGTSYYREWWSNYPQDFNLRTLQQYYLGFDYWSMNGMLYKILPCGAGYVYYPSFSYSIGEGNLDYLISYFKDCSALIIDIRNNGGGELSNVHTLVGRFIDNEITGGYMRHKTGPGHDDFSAPYAVRYKPTGDGHLHWSAERRVMILTNRSCFSSANDFVAVMKMLPNVEIIGATTGGGGGMPFTYDLPNGWKLRLSTSPLYDCNMESIEAGIEPSAGCAVSAPDKELAEGKDAILDFAISRTNMAISSSHL